MGNLKEVSTLHILGKSIQCNNILKKKPHKLQTFNLFKNFTLLTHMYDSKKIHTMNDFYYVLKTKKLGKDLQTLSLVSFL